MLDRLESPSRETVELSPAEERAEAAREKTSLLEAKRRVANEYRGFAGEQGKINERLRTDALGLAEPLFSDHQKAQPEEYQRVLDEAEQMVGDISVHEMAQRVHDGHISKTVLERLLDHYVLGDKDVPADKFQMLQNIKAVLTGKIEKKDLN